MSRAPEALVGLEVTHLPLSPPAIERSPIFEGIFDVWEKNGAWRSRLAKSSCDLPTICSATPRGCGTFA